MKTLEYIQQDVAKEHNCKDWTVLRNSLYGNRIKFGGIWMDVAKRYALEVAREALYKARVAAIQAAATERNMSRVYVSIFNVIEDEKNIPI